ncbi:hypothetical protein TCAL_06407 [Tigriopus californicus]|uniref:RNA polymerase II-associated protein 3 n=1 Tax=Tigriopus californicus TaxID=6832 RepID=A0A553PAI8_TIGCA|nr:RNA polymerase II-associated protein 3-like [Tigriopus californicus]TRY74699.1 hypothetical protein TCAL_06407 [Tigriopus californicus]|eukprot:TCALIF_06407-PA protein Name:"Similar to RPAP3 RNA polymerase II-associated protein 3 (Gallus gallus)" AED:0.39 eAED:0.39 QI:0/-1/0/1/-1/1/1/0/453
MASPEEMRALTDQFKNNAEDLQAYMRDLNHWEEEMKRKDEQLRALKRGNPGGIAEIGDKKKSAENENQLSSEQMHQKAIMEKEKGNEYFKKGQFDLAIECYSRGIQAHPTNPMIIANRAMAYLKIQRFQDAEDDCTLAVALDPTYVKAFMRRGTARMSLNRVSEAVEDFQKVVEFEPKNRQAKSDLEQALMKLNNTGKVTRNKREALPPKSVNIHQDLLAKPKPTRLDQDTSHESVLKSLKLNDVQDESDYDVQASQDSNLLQDISVKQKETQSSFLTPVSSKKIETVSADLLSTGSKPKFKFQEEPKSALIIPQKPAQGPKPKPIPVEVKVELKPVELIKPKSSVQFYSHWRRHSRERKSLYLQLLSAKDYPLIFKQSLEPQVFTEILEALMQVQIGVGNHLLGLSQVPRITALVMFLSEQEKSNITQLVEKAKNDSGLSENDLQKITSTFS